MVQGLRTEVSNITTNTDFVKSSYTQNVIFVSQYMQLNNVLSSYRCWGFIYYYFDLFVVYFSA